MGLVSILTCVSSGLLFDGAYGVSQANRRVFYAAAAARCTAGRLVPLEALSY